MPPPDHFGVVNGLFLVAQHRLPLFHDSVFVCLRLLGEWFINKVKIGLADGLLRIFESKPPGIGLVDHAEPMVAILEKYVVRGVVHQLLK